MNNWMWSVLVFVVTLGLMLLLNLPATVFFLVIVPLLIFIFIQGSFAYSFRESLAPAEIPARGFESRIRETEKRMGDLPRGFTLIDRFYLKAIPDSVTYAFLQESEPVICCIYNFGSKQAVDFVTVYNDGFSLTTNDMVDGGAAPRPRKSFIQIFEGQSYEKLYQRHMESHIFLIEQGLKPYFIHAGEFRHVFMREYRDQAEFIRNTPFWPFKLLVGVVSKAGKKYAIPLRRQVEDGITKIYG